MKATVLFLLLCAPALADRAACQQSFGEKAFATAFKECLPLAQQGNAEAQVYIGAMYTEGQGVPQDYKEAVRWYRLAADQGFTPAQFNLGVSYAKGQGVPQDFVLAHMWLNLAGASGNDRVIKARDIVAAKMTPAQIAEAQRLAREWKPKK